MIGPLSRRRHPPTVMEPLFGCFFVEPRSSNWYAGAFDPSIRQITGVVHLRDRRVLFHGLQLRCSHPPRRGFRTCFTISSVGGVSSSSRTRLVPATWRSPGNVAPFVDQALRTRRRASLSGAVHITRFRPAGTYAGRQVAFGTTFEHVQRAGARRPAAHDPYLGALGHRGEHRTPRPA